LEANDDGLYLHYIQQIEIHPVTSRVYVSSDNLYLSDDGGTSWRTVPGRLRVAIDPIDPDIMYATEFRNGLRKSLDGGVTWKAIGDDITTPGTLAIHPHNPQLLVVNDGDPWQSTDGGDTWTQGHVDSDTPDVRNMSTIVFDPVNPGTVYAGSGFRRNEGDRGIGVVLKSTDAGHTWSVVSQQPIGKGPVQALAVDHVNPSVLYAGGATKADDGFYRSTDGGGNWTKIHEGGPSAVVIDPLNPSVVYSAMRAIERDVLRFTFDGSKTAVDQTSWGAIKGSTLLIGE